MSQLKTLIHQFKDNYNYEIWKVDFFHQSDEKLTFPEKPKTLSKIDYQFFLLNDKLKKLLEENDIAFTNDLLLDIPNLAWADFVFTIKEVFDENKDKYSNIKDFADSINSVLSQSWLFEEVNQQWIFINLKVKNTFLESDIKLALTEDFSSFDLLDWEKICIDYPSCNMAKQMTVGHLRSAIIWDSLANIWRNLWANVFRWNYLWDWWTPFGKTLYSLLYTLETKWDQIFDELEKNPTKVLGELYSSFKDIENEEKWDKAREYFSMLEKWDELLYKIRQEFRRLSLIDFQEVFNRLDMSFDTDLGEAFAYSIQDSIVSDLENSDYLRFENNAWIVKFRKEKNWKEIYYIPLKSWEEVEEENSEVLIITKSDGAGVYATRDLAILKYRKENLLADSFFYVVWPEQTLHFQLLFALANKLRDIDLESMNHIVFGLMLLDWSKMSSRGGNVYRLAELIDAIKEKIETNFADIDPALAEKLAISAMIFNDLKNDRQKDVNFDLEQMTKLNGDTWVYLQYTFARINSLIWKIDLSGCGNLDIDKFSSQQRQILLNVSYLPLILTKTFNQRKPHILCQFVLNIAKQFNNFYSNSEKIIDMTEEEKSINLIFLKVLKNLFEKSFEILNMPKVEKM